MFSSRFREVRFEEMYSVFIGEESSVKGEHVGEGVIVMYAEDLNKKIRDKYVLLRKEGKPICYRFSDYRLFGRHGVESELNIANPDRVLLDETEFGNEPIAEEVLRKRGL